MDKLNSLINNWQVVTLLLGSSGGGGWLGYFLASKSRKLTIQEKTFKIQSEMIDGVKKDFEERIDYLKSYNTHLESLVNHFTENNKKLNSIIQRQDEIIMTYQKKYGKLNEN